MPIGRPSLEDTKWSNTRAILQSIRRQEIVHTIQKGVSASLKVVLCILDFLSLKSFKIVFRVQRSFSSEFPLLGSKSTNTRRLTNETKFKKLESA